jgi:hypothetical protein
MSSTIEFTASVNTACDSCRRPTKVGLYHLHNGTPVMFDCVPCAERMVGATAVQEAIDLHKEIAFLRMEAPDAAPVRGLW